MERTGRLYKMLLGCTCWSNRQEREAVLYTYRKDSWTVQSLHGPEWNRLFSEPSEKYKAEALSLHLAPPQKIWTKPRPF